MDTQRSYEFVPYLSVIDAENAIAFYSSVFGTMPHMRIDMPDGRLMHAEFRVGTARFYVSEELLEHGGTPSPKTLGGTTVSIHLYVDDCDAIIGAMAENGGEILMEPMDMFWGERFGRIRDPFGHEWGVATKLTDLSPDEIQSAAARMFSEMEKKG